MRSIIHVSRPRDGKFKLKVVSSFFDLSKPVEVDGVLFSHNDLLRVTRVHARQVVFADSMPNLHIELPSGYIGQEVEFQAASQARALAVREWLLKTFKSLPEYSAAAVHV